MISTTTERSIWALSLCLLREEEQENREKKNLLISPLSILSALKLAELGASGETQHQLQSVLGSDAESAQEMEHLISRFSRRTNALKSANAVYASRRAELKDSYREMAGEKLGAEVLRENTDPVSLVNDWVEEHTNQMIPSLIQKRSDLGDFSLLNALAFQDKWKEKYEPEDIKEERFFYGNSRLAQKRVAMMKSTESIYLENAAYTGFLKPYRNPRFAFLALLPREAIFAPQSLLAGLTDAAVPELLKGQENCEVIAHIPQFTFDYHTELSNSLKKLGVKDAFLPEKADFKPMTDLPETYIEKIIHKTHIEVDAEGTKAAAVTDICCIGSGLGFRFEQKIVRLDRPFLFAILDTETNLPIFLGTVNKI